MSSKKKGQSETAKDQEFSNEAIEVQSQRINHVNIEEEMRRAYIDYSMSVIVGRALPDARDGLKPCNRRILFAMKDGGYLKNRPYVKCATVVGDVLGRYHPHGDSSVYDALVRMAQDFSMRYPLIDKQGNFGSIDGDPPAAYRYTECRLEKTSEEMLADIEKDTVVMQKTFDEKRDEPSVLPARFPNLLVNGSTGIAVGMATNIPPHNLGEVIDGTVYLIDHPDATVPELMQYIKGPDFPTAGIICGLSAIRKAYETGRGHLTVRGRATIEDWENGRERIIVSEIPYGVNKAMLIEQIADLVRDKRIEGISDLRDESDKDGIRVVIELKRGEMGQIVLNNLYKHTQLSVTFGVIMLAIDHGRPHIMNLKEVLKCFVDHRFDVLTRRTKFELKEAQARAHILEGLLLALEHLDDVVRIIRESRNRDDARVQLIANFGFSEIQANAILDMRLYQLTGLGREALENEYKALQERIAYLQSLLADDALLYGVMKDELMAVRAGYADPRRTELTIAEVEMNMEDLIADEDCVVSLSHGGYLKRTPTSEYREQRRGGKGLHGMDTKDEDYVEHVFNCSAHDWMLFFTEFGRMYFKKAYEIPEGSRTSKGKALVNWLNISATEKIAAIIPVRGFDPEKYILFATERGVVKKTPLSSFRNVRAKGLIAIHVDEGDRVIGVEVTGGEDDVMLVTRNGIGIRFHESEVRKMGRASRGVRGIRLREGDVVEAVRLIKPDTRLLTVMEKGVGKRSDFEDYRVTHRGGSGIIAAGVTEKTGALVTALSVRDDDTIMIVTKGGTMIRMPVETVRVTGRNAQGVKLIDLEGDDVVMSATPVEAEADAPVGDAANAADESGADLPDTEGEGDIEADNEGEAPADE